jgi:phage-related tail fiber protein
MKENILLKIKKIFLIAILLITLVLFYFYFSIYSGKKNTSASADLAPGGSPPMSKQFLLSDSDGNLSQLYMTGAIFYFAMQNPPEGFLVCDGSAISRSTYNTLFNVINNLYGNGDGNTTFNLPDLRGQFIRGFDSSGSVDRDRNKAGFGTKQEDALIEFSYSASVEGGSINVGGSSASGITQNGGPSWGGGRFSFDSRNFNPPGSGDRIKTSTETRPKNISLLPCIKY